MWELDAIAAVVIGGTSLFGGRGTIIGTFMGVILLKLINNGLTLAQLETFWQMVVLGLIILVAVGLDIVRQSKSAVKVQRMLGVVALVLALFACLTPGSALISSAISLHEHNSMVAMQAAGLDLAANQTARLLDAPAVAELQAIVSGNWLSFASLLVLVLGAVAVAVTLKRSLALILAAVYVAAAVLLVSMGMAAVAPLLILGAVVLAGMTTVPYMFERARTLEG
jgi:hypothetical protein